MESCKIFHVWHVKSVFDCIVFAKDKTYAKRKAIKRMMKIKNIKTAARDWEVEEFTPKTYGGCFSFSD